MTLNRASPPDFPLPPSAAGDDDDSGIGIREGQGQVGIATRTRAKPKKPSQYKVLMLNTASAACDAILSLKSRRQHVKSLQEWQVDLRSRVAESTGGRE